MDAGIGDYSRSAFLANIRYTIWPFRSTYHNVPLIGGIEQKPGKVYAASHVTWTGDVISMDLAPAYGDSRIQTWIRTAAFDRQTTSIRITENYALADEMPIDLNFLLCAPPEIGEGEILLGENVVLSFEGLSVSCRKLDREYESYPVPGWSMHGYSLHLLTFSTRGTQGTISYQIEAH